MIPRDQFEIVDSTVVWDAGFLSASRISVRAPDGESLERHVVHHPGAVVVVPIDAEGRVVMVRQWRVAAGRSLLEIPAGKRDVAGEPPETTAARELEEEIGQRPGTLHALCEFYNSPGFCDEYTYLFLATDLVPTARAAVSAEEAAMTVEAVALDDIDALIARRELVDAKSIIGVLTARSFLRGAPGA
ncbi:MAG: NUDIX hydrolase [Acidimicrobiia bacterium]